MRRLNSSLSLCCPQHPSRNIEGLDPTIGETKLLYCVDCILESDDPKAIYHRIQTFPNFLDEVAKLYDLKRTGSEETTEHQEECLRMVMQKVEAINTLKNHLEKEKKKIEESFESMKRFLNEVLDQKKAEYLSILNNQVEKIHKEFEFFEKNLNEFYPYGLCGNVSYPTREELEAKFKRAHSINELSKFIEDLKNELGIGKDNIEKALNDVFKQTALDTFKNHLFKLKLQPPSFDISIQNLEQKITKSFQKHADASFILKNPIITGGSEVILSDSADFLTIRSWLPPQYQSSFRPNLIYKGLKDGMDPDNFYLKCENKSNTITLIKGKFKGSSEAVVIGGFIDKPWLRNGFYSISKDAFIFSLTSKVKCPIVNYKCASYTGPEILLAFGAGYDIVIKKELAKSCVLPHSFKDAKKIVNGPYKGFGPIDFEPIDMEVFTI